MNWVCTSRRACGGFCPNRSANADPASLVVVSLDEPGSFFPVGALLFSVLQVLGPHKHCQYLVYVGDVFTRDQSRRYGVGSKMPAWSRRGVQVLIISSMPAGSSRSR